MCKGVREDGGIEINIYLKGWMDRLSADIDGVFQSMHLSDKIKCTSVSGTVFI